MARRLHWQVLLVRVDEEGGSSKGIVVEHVVELITALTKTVLIRGVDDPDKGVGAIVVLPQCADLILTSNCIHKRWQITIQRQLNNLSFSPSSVETHDQEFTWTAVVCAHKSGTRQCMQAQTVPQRHRKILYLTCSTLKPIVGTVCAKSLASSCRHCSLSGLHANEQEIRRAHPHTHYEACAAERHWLDARTLSRPSMRIRVSRVLGRDRIQRFRDEQAMRPTCAASSRMWRDAGELDDARQRKPLRTRTCVLDKPTDHRAVGVAETLRPGCRAGATETLPAARDAQGT